MTKKKSGTGYYSSEPYAPSSKKATQTALPSPSTGQAVSPTVPVKPSRSSGFGGGTHAAGHRLAHGYGHSVVKRLGGLRLSGHVAAHRLGKR